MGEFLYNAIIRFFALVFVVLLVPLYLLISIAIFVDSRGPILFCQKRVGKDRKIFSIFKFRTMYVHEIFDQKEYKTTESAADARITRVGKFLRKSSLDELPQFLNVFCGHMTLVGPRPILPEQLDAICGLQHQRFSVLPGITGLAQIKGRRSLHWHQQLRLDSFYAKSRSLKLDLFIVIRTFAVVLAHKDIYGSNVKNWRSYLPKSNGE